MTARVHTDKASVLTVDNKACPPPEQPRGHRGQVTIR